MSVAVDEERIAKWLAIATVVGLVLFMVGAILK